MILIADSGSTKTDWRLVDNSGKIHSHATIGFNPYFQTSEQITNELQKKLLPLLSIADSPLNIYFYGAGCSSTAMCSIVEKALRNVFKIATVEINHDLLAAARALCGKNEGIAAILGTGSNSCYYDSSTIAANIPSLGYLLGDEGSGSHIGKTFIAAYLYDLLPSNLSSDFFNKYKLNKEIILENTYRKPLPNKFLASFCEYIGDNIDNKYVFNLVKNCFSLFFENHICRYPQHQSVPLGCVGSVGYHFKDILKEVAEEKGVVIQKNMQSPIEELVAFHLAV